MSWVISVILRTQKMFSLMYLPILKMSQVLLMVFFIPYPLFNNIFLQLNRSQKLELTVNSLSKQALMFKIGIQGHKL